MFASQAADRQLFQLVEWAKRVPHFVELPIDDQVILLRAGEATLMDQHHNSVLFKQLTFNHVESRLVVTDSRENTK